MLSLILYLKLSDIQILHQLFKKQCITYLCFFEEWLWCQFIVSKDKIEKKHFHKNVHIGQVLKKISIDWSICTLYNDYDYVNQWWQNPVLTPDTLITQSLTCSWSWYFWPVPAQAHIMLHITVVLLYFHLTAWCWLVWQ